MGCGLQQAGCVFVSRDHGFDGAWTAFRVGHLRVAFSNDGFASLRILDMCRPREKETQQRNSKVEGGNRV